MSLAPIGEVEVLKQEQSQREENEPEQVADCCERYWIAEGPVAAAAAEEQGQDVADLPAAAKSSEKPEEAQEGAALEVQDVPGIAGSYCREAHNGSSASALGRMSAPWDPSQCTA